MTEVKLLSRSAGGDGSAKVVETSRTGDERCWRESETTSASQSEPASNMWSIVVLFGRRRVVSLPPQVDIREEELHDRLVISAGQLYDREVRVE